MAKPGQWSWLVWLSFGFLQIQAGNPYFSAGARRAGLGSNGLVLFDAWAACQNQAGAAKVQKVSAGAGYHAAYLIPGLGYRAVFAALPLARAGVFSGSYLDAGNDDYREQKAGLGFAKNFGGKIYAGAQLNLLRTSIGSNYGNANHAAFELGFIVPITPKLDIGAHVFNPSRSRLAEFRDERSGTVFQVGLGYRVGTQVLLFSEAEKNVFSPVIFRSGIEYACLSAFYLRLGAAFNPGRFSFGFGYRWKKITLDIASNYHPDLGFSPGLSLAFEP